MSGTRTHDSTRRARHLVAALDHADAHLLAIAAHQTAQSIEALDALSPSLKARTDVQRLRYLSRVLKDANSARDFIETGE